jgi:hypothetical protein
LTTAQGRSNLAAGWADGVTFGITQRIREKLGFDDVLDKNSNEYGVGLGIGMIHSFRLAGTTLGRGLFIGHGTSEIAEGVANGDPMQILRGIGLVAMGASGGGSVCEWENRIAKIAVRGGAAAGAVGYGSAAVDSFANGEYLNGSFNLLLAAKSLAPRPRTRFMSSAEARPRPGNSSKEISDYSVNFSSFLTGI